ncbi:MAG: CoA-binding protein [Desulfobacterales bacterium]|nr:CoA-binding protein [Desulfobacterales bacterium]
MPLTPLMEKRLRAAFHAKRIAVVGASEDQLSIGMGPVYNLITYGFKGEVLPVNPKHDKILGQKCYPDLESIHPPPDLAILVLNERLAVDMTERAAKHGVGAVTIVAGGFGEVRAGGGVLHERLKEIAFRYELPVIGPNTLGFCALNQGQNGVFSHFTSDRGNIAIISQSGGVGMTIAFRLQDMFCEPGYFVGVGNQVVLNFADYLQILRDAPDIHAFALFVEGVEDPRSLYEALRATALKKPLVVYKAGKNEGVSKATATHTGSLTGEYRLYKAMFKQAGALEVNSTHEAAVAAKALSMVGVPAGNRLCAFTYTAGPCIVAMDRLLEKGWELPDLTDRARSKVRSVIGEKIPVDLQNPVDLTGPGSLPKFYSSVFETVLNEDYDAYLLVYAYSAHTRVPSVELVSLIKQHSGKSVVLVLMGKYFETAPYLKELTAKGVCVFSTPEDGAVALNALLSRSHFLKRISADDHA